MQFGAHLPLIDFEGTGWRHGSLPAYARAASRLGYEWLTVNDHLVFGRPWLDGLVALASVVEASGDLKLATSVVLPVVRGPAAVAKAAAALDIVSGGRLVLGVGPGSSAGDYGVAAVPFDERWTRFDESVRVLRAQLRVGEPAATNGHYAAIPPLRPQPVAPEGPPIWIASWGSDAGLRRVARLGDGWLASAYNTTPAQLAVARGKLGDALTRNGRRHQGFPCALATMWTYVTNSDRVRDARLADLSAMLNRPADQLADRVLVGSVDHCVALLRAYADAGVDVAFLWPLADAEEQLERFMRDVAPAVERSVPQAAG